EAGSNTDEIVSKDSGNGNHAGEVWARYPRRRSGGRICPRAKTACPDRQWSGGRMKTASLGSDPLMAHQLLLLSRTSLCLPSERMVLHDSESKPAKAVLKEKLEFLLKK